MAGNILGGRSYYGYTADNGDTYSILMDDSLATAVSGVLNDSNPAPPRRFSPRGVYVEVTVGGRLKRKKLTIPDPTSALYTNITTTDFVIDGVTYKSTGRVGEKITFARNADAPDPGDEDGTV